MEKRRLLVVEDEPDIRELISFNLEVIGYEVIKASDGDEAIEMAESESPDLILLDLMLPKKSGFEVCEIIRKSPKMKAIPIIMLTAKSAENDVIAGLKVGADDYITKPFSPKVLVARVEAVLRRSGKLEDKNSINVHTLEIDMVRHIVKNRGVRIELSATEFSILELLSSEPGRVFSRDQIISSIKGSDYPVTSRSVDVHILSLRRKLDTDDFIETIRGVGYRFREEL